MNIKKTLSLRRSDISCRYMSGTMAKVVTENIREKWSRRSGIDAAANAALDRIR